MSTQESMGVRICTPAGVSRRFPVQIFLAAVALFSALQAQAQVHAQNPGKDSKASDLNLELFDVQADRVDAMEDRAALKIRIARGIDRISTGVDNYPKHRECFSCHHQAVPLFAFRSHQTPDSALFLFGEQSWGDQSERRERILDFTRKSLAREMSGLQADQELGGRGMTLGYALWTMSVGLADWGKTGDELVQKAIDTQQADGRWRIHSVRPPAASSEMMATALVVSGLNHYEASIKDPVQHQRKVREIRKSIYRAVLWRSRQPEPVSTASVSTEDLCGTLWLDYETASILEVLRFQAMMGPTRPGVGNFPESPESPELSDLANPMVPYLSDSELEELLRFAGQGRTKELRDVLLKRQNQDGGWGYEPGRESDAYSTATAMLFLVQTRDYKKARSYVTNPWFRYGLAYLIRTQKDDGSWHVSSIANPVQEYFDNGDPHETDQFLSMQATGWAVAVLASAYHNTLFPLSAPARRLVGPP